MTITADVPESRSVISFLEAVSSMISPRSPVNDEGEQHFVLDHFYQGMHVYDTGIIIQGGTGAHGISSRSIAGGDNRVVCKVLPLPLSFTAHPYRFDIDTQIADRFDAQLHLSGGSPWQQI